VSAQFEETNGNPFAVFPQENEELRENEEFLLGSRETDRNTVKNNKDKDVLRTLTLQEHWRGHLLVPVEVNFKKDTTTTTAMPKKINVFSNNNNNYNNFNNFNSPDGLTAIQVLPPPQSSVPNLNLVTTSTTTKRPKNLLKRPKNRKKNFFGNLKNAFHKFKNNVFG